MHWADAFASRLQGKQLFSTGISPSGPIHVGNMREILTGDIMYRASLDRGLESRFIYLCDDMDPLRKVYPFLTDDYREHVGKPLSMIPAPDGGEKYSEYFLEPFIGVLETLDINVEVIRTTDLYEKGVFAESIDIVMGRRDEIAGILEEVSGRELPEGWYPYNPLCEACGRINSTTVTGYVNPYVQYTCKCGHEGKADIRRAEGKMPWRVEWPAKWYALGVTVEPFGKDHGAAGGSYDSGKRISEEIFNSKAPDYLIYERILLKGKGAMHSSTGNVIAASDMIKFAPPQTLRFLIARVQPGKHITFDPGAGLLNLIDEYEKLENQYHTGDLDEDSRRTYELSRLDESTENLSRIGFRHLVTIVQIYPDEKDLLAAMQRADPGVNEISPVMRKNISAIRIWLEEYAPENVKFTLLPVDAAVEVDEVQRKLVSGFLESSRGMEWSPEEIHNTMHQLIRDSGLNPKDGFAAFYRILVGKERGPRLGYFLYTLGRDFTEKRLSNALKM